MRRVALFLMIVAGCSTEPEVIDFPGPLLYGTVGTVMLQLDSVLYSTGSAVATRGTLPADLLLNPTLVSGGDFAYMTAELRMSGTTASFSKFVVRVGAEDSTAQFYGWNPDLHDPSFRSEIRVGGDTLVGLFGGWLRGLDNRTSAPEMLVRRGTVNVLIAVQGARAQEKNP